MCEKASTLIAFANSCYEHELMRPNSCNCLLNHGVVSEYFEKSGIINAVSPPTAVLPGFLSQLNDLTSWVVKTKQYCSCDFHHCKFVCRFPDSWKARFIYEMVFKALWHGNRNISNKELKRFQETLKMTATESARTKSRVPCLADRCGQRHNQGESKLIRLKSTCREHGVWPLKCSKHINSSFRAFCVHYLLCSACWRRVTYVSERLASRLVGWRWTTRFLSLGGCQVVLSLMYR